VSIAFPFHSALTNDFKAYIELKRALGMKLVNAERILRHLDRFLGRRFPVVTDLSVSILEAWMTESPALKPQSRAARLWVVRQFCLYRRRTSPAAFVPDSRRDWSLWPINVPRRVPFLYSTDQIRVLLQTALELPAISRNPHRPQTMFMILLLLYTTGLRVSEALRVQIDDVDLEAGTLRIRETKFFKTRLVPVAADVLVEVRKYIESLRLPVTQASRERTLFLSRNGRPYTPSSFSSIGSRLLRLAGLKPSEGRCGPRLHDLRHTMAVHRITRWYQEGADVQSRLPMLATYMGHKNIASTQYYATVTVDILEYAGRRFELLCAPDGRG
jgi:integrase/recombinase XerD